MASKSANTVATTDMPADQGTSARPGYANSATRQKYRAQRTVVDGISFASKAEAKRYLELKAMETQGAIERLELQPKYPVVIDGKKICTYIADFRYFTPSECIVEDCKGYRTPVYLIKKKLIEALYRIKIQEVVNGKIVTGNPSRKATGPRKKKL